MEEEEDEEKEEGRVYELQFTAVSSKLLFLPKGRMTRKWGVGPGYPPHAVQMVCGGGVNGQRVRKYTAITQRPYSKTETLGGVTLTSPLTDKWKYE